jgi:hypothetical protein
MEANAEATATYVNGTIIQPLLGNGNVVFWRDGKAETVDLLPREWTPPASGTRVSQCSSPAR